MTNIICKELGYKIMNIAFQVHNALGPGLLESAYEEGLCWEFRHAGIPFSRQQVFPLIYKGDYISSYIADLVVDNKVILEIKSVKQLNELMQAQIINYLKLSKIEVGYLLNFNAVRLYVSRLSQKISIDSCNFLTKLGVFKCSFTIYGSFENIHTVCKREWSVGRSRLLFGIQS